MIRRLTPIMAGLMAATVCPQAAAQTVGVNAAVLNDVNMTTQANPKRHRAVVKERVSLGNAIDTGRASRLQVMLLDRTIFSLGSNSRITVDRFIYDPNRKASAVGLSVARGTFRFMSSKALHANPGQSAISTPVATIGVRGTIVEGAIGPDAIRIAAREAALGEYTADPETASLILLRGPGPAAERGETPGAIDVTAAGVTVPVETPGFAVFIPGRNQRPIGPFRLSARGSALLSTLVGTDSRRGRFDENDLLRRNPINDQFFEKGGSRSQSPGG